MQYINYMIFNQVVRINYNDSEFSAVLKKELSVYPTASDQSEVELKIIIGNANDVVCKYRLGRNPKEHFYAEDVFGVDFGWGKVFWIFDERTIYVCPNKYNYNYIRKQYALLRDPQFCLPDQWAGQRIHEDVLVGNILFRENMFVLHGSAMSTKDGRVVVVGGTGGTGKTSTLISLGKRADVFFVCDDLCVVDNSGKVFVNYAYPKIYAYNVIGSKEFEEKLLENDSAYGRFQWSFRKKISPSSVRRRMHPKSLYHLLPEEAFEKLHLDAYVILNRSDAVDSFSVDELTPEQACNMSYYIIRNEMNKFFVPLSYRNLNALYFGNKNPQDPDLIFDKWKEYMLSVFSNIKIYKINIPFSYDNERLKREMSRTLANMMELK